MWMSYLGCCGHDSNASPAAWLAMRWFAGWSRPWATYGKDGEARSRRLAALVSFTIWARSLKRTAQRVLCCLLLRVCGRHSACAGDSDHPAADGVNTRSEGRPTRQAALPSELVRDAGQMKVGKIRGRGDGAEVAERWALLNPAPAQTLSFGWGGQRGLLHHSNSATLYHYARHTS